MAMRTFALTELSAGTRPQPPSSCGGPVVHQVGLSGDVRIAASAGVGGAVPET
jgi:hypothetical protein